MVGSRPEKPTKYFSTHRVLNGMRQDVAFESEGEELSGWFYSPDTSPP